MLQDVFALAAFALERSFPAYEERARAGEANGVRTTTERTTTTLVLLTVASFCARGPGKKTYFWRGINFGQEGVDLGNRSILFGRSQEEAEWVAWLSNGSI